MEKITNDLAELPMVSITELTAMSETEVGIRWEPLDDPKVQGYRVRTSNEVNPKRSKTVHKNCLEFVF